MNLPYQGIISSAICKLGTLYKVSLLGNLLCRQRLPQIRSQKQNQKSREYYPSSTQLYLIWKTHHQQLLRKIGKRIQRLTYQKLGGLKYSNVFTPHPFVQGTALFNLRLCTGFICLRLNFQKFSLGSVLYVIDVSRLPPAFIIHFGHVLA